MKFEYRFFCFIWSRLNRQSALILLLFSRTKNNTKPKTLEQKMKRELHCDTMDLYSEFRYQFEISRIHFTKVSVPIFIIKFEKLIIQIESTNKRTHAAQMLPRARTLSRSLTHRRPSKMYTSERAHGRAFAYLQDFQNDWKRTKEICSRTTKSLCLTHNGLSKVFFSRLRD